MGIFLHIDVTHSGLCTDCAPGLLVALDTQKWFIDTPFGQHF